MDLYIDAKLEELVDLFRSSGFEVTEKDNYFSAKFRKPMGRFHVTFSELEDKVYCDLHFDYKIHFFFFGVAYKNKPKEFFEKEIRKIFEDKNISFEIKEVNWFTRRNKAIFHSFRLYSP